MSHQATPDAAEHGCLVIQTQHAASSMLHTTEAGSRLETEPQHDNCSHTQPTHAHTLTRRPALLKTGLARSMQHATETGCYDY